MRWKPWLLASLSVLLLACATAPPEPVLKVALTTGGPMSKRSLELNGRSFTITLTSMGLDKKPVARTASGTLGREEYQRLLARFDALDLAAFKELYTSSELRLAGLITSVRIEHRGTVKSVLIVGPLPAEVEPLLGPLLPLLDRGFF